MPNKIESSLEELVPSSVNNILAIEPEFDGTALLYLRNNGKVNCKEVPFHPFLLLSDTRFLESFIGEYEIVPLKGKAFYRYIAKFPNQKTYFSALKHLKTSTGFTSSAPKAPYMIFSDFQQQVMVQNNIRLFRGMKFSDVRRIQFDIETLTTYGYDFPNPMREHDKIIVITMSDNTGWEKYLVVKDKTTEKDVLEEFVSIIKERNPDVLEGHNIFKFDLPFIEERAKRHRVDLAIGRNNSVPKTRSSRFSVAERIINYKRYEVHGRHIVDTYFLAQLYDVVYRDLESYGLKSIAQHFGVASRDRTYIDAGEIEKYYNDDKGKLLSYALDDVRETKAISEILSPSYFYQTQLEPYSYQNIIVRGNATKIDSMLIASYLEEKESIPKPEAARQFIGGLTESFEAGIFKNVWHCDIRSLYPSIVIANNWNPSRDKLAKFPFFLEKLRTFRLAAKDHEKQAKTSEEREYFKSLQSTFKIMINSFYGYLGFGFGAFNDFEMAEKVTEFGRKTLTTMLDFLIGKQAKPIEMDTDGIYFQPPSDIKSTEKMEKMIQDILPEGIDVELDSVHKAMFAYKSKNYALINGDGKLSITGAALKSRGVEPFIREYLKKFLTLLLNEKFDEIHKLTDQYKTDIENRSIPLNKLAKTETLKESPNNYKVKIFSGKGRRSAAYELALNAKRDYTSGDQISYYVIGIKKKLPVVGNSCLLSDAPKERDENTAYYINKLDEIYKKFAVLCHRHN